jgi:hypothetical protein
VRILRTTFIVMLALLWAPLASHCLLESVLTSEFLSCCDHQATPAPHENNCHSDSCATVEAGQYQSALQRLTLAPPTLQLHFESHLLTPSALTLVAGLPGERSDTAVPPPAPWQFVFRTALSPRAPSLVS